MFIRTARLDLIPMSPAFIEASLARDPKAASAALGATVPALWPEEDYLHVLKMRLGQLQEDPSLLPWLMRAMVLRETGEMIGDIGFHTRPGAEYLQPCSPHAVEFGFGVFPSHQRQGFAREAAQGMMQWAREHHGITEFILTIRPDNLPSQALAAQLGFVRISSHIDEIDGEEDILELRMG